MPELMLPLVAKPFGPEGGAGVLLAHALAYAMASHKKNVTEMPGLARTPDT